MKHIKVILPVCFILGISFLTLSPCLKNGFVNLDDQRYVTENRWIMDPSWKILKSIFSQFYAGHYHPLTLLTYSLEFYLFKLNPLPYHATNLFLHLLNTLLVFCVIRRLRSDLLTSSVAALLFSIHPLHVESVAWISQRKDLLYSLFFLGSWICYLRYREKEKSSDYLLSLILFVLSVLSKSMGVTLPVVLLLSDYLLHRPFNKKIFFEKVPFFVLSILFGIIAFFARAHAETGGPDSLSLFQQLLSFNFILFFFLSKLILPVGLSCYYPYFKPAGLSLGNMLFYPLVVTCLFFIGVLSSRWSRKIPFGLLFLLVTLLPVLPLRIFAERYTYLPYTGIFYIIGEGLSSLLTGRFRSAKMARTFLLILFTGVIITLITLSYQRCRIWKDSLTLWNDVLRNYPDFLTAYHHRGTTYLDMGEYEKAISDYQRVLKTDPDHPKIYSVYHNLGAAYHNRREFDQAIYYYSKSVKNKPDYFLAYHHRGLIHMERKEFQRALEDFNKVIEINPGFAEAYYNRGNVYMETNRPDQAISDYARAIGINPKFYPAYYNRGVLYAREGLHDQAIADYHRAILIHPGYAEAYANRGVSYFQKGLFENALRDFNKALEVNPAYAEASFNKALVLEKMGRMREASEAYERFIQVASPQHAKQIDHAKRRIKTHIP